MVVVVGGGGGESFCRCYCCGRRCGCRRDFAVVFVPLCFATETFCKLNDDDDAEPRR